MDAEKKEKSNTGPSEVQDNPLEKKKLDLERWMELLPETLHNIPLLSLAIPGSHDAASYSLDPRSEIAPDEPELHYPGWFMGCLMKHIVFNWCKTQTMTCRQQLDSGVRYFDFRVATRSDSPDLHIVHGLYGAPVKAIMQELKVFLETHSKEVVLLDFQHFYKMTPEDHHKLILLLISFFEPMLCPLVADPNVLTLSWLWARQFQVIIFYRDPIAKFHPFLWPGKLIPNPWPNTVSVSGLLDFLNRKYAGGRPPGVFYVTQAVLTPSLLYIFRHLFGNLKTMLATAARLPLLRWLEDKVPAGVNIVMCDFVDMDNCQLPESVVELNYKMIGQEKDKEKLFLPEELVCTIVKAFRLKVGCTDVALRLCKEADFKAHWLHSWSQVLSGGENNAFFRANHPSGVEKFMRLDITNQQSKRIMPKANIQAR